MITNTLTTNQISCDAYAWYLGYLAAIDDKDVTKYGEHLADDCVMIQNNQEPVSGKAAILAGLATYWQTFRHMEHELLNIYGTDTAFALEAWNHYVRNDGGKVSVRAVALTDRLGQAFPSTSGLVKHFRF